MIVFGKERDYVVHSDTEIKGMFGEYRYLSNFHNCPVQFDGVIYPSSENAYMAAKTLDLQQREQFETISPKDAKDLGRTIDLRPDWEIVKYDIMYKILFDKFSRNSDIRQKLLETGEKYLEETNHWGDRIWGVVDGVGKSALGKILMQIRSALRLIDELRQD
jgi:ribA/ribD-fused uncharacterized protein